MNLNDRSQLRAARALLGITQEELAEKSGVSLPTIKRVEPGKGPLDVQNATRIKLERALLRLGVEFLNDDKPGVRLNRSSRAP